ncbi:8915_t:CDS:2, partial [Entrophospora sp. SA101]
MTSLKDYLTNLLITNAKIQFALTALSASILTGLSIFSYQSYQRDQKTKALKREFKSLPPSTALINHRIRDINELLKDDSEPEKYEEKIIREQLTRNISFLGEEGVEKLRKSFVIIIGAGGVGSWAVLMLIRSGVEHIRIIDFDQVTVSSLNRHAVATHADVGFSKVIALKKHLKQIAPWAKVEAVTEIFNNIDPLEMARQLTILESKLFKKIMLGEFLTKNRENAKNIKELIKKTNHTSKWIIESTLTQTKNRTRSLVIKHFINVANECRNLNNFSSMVGIISGLTSFEVFRLKN